MLRISKAALVAAVISLSAVPSVGTLPALAEDSSPLELSIPTVVPVDSTMDEAAIRDALSGGFMKHTDELAELSAASITIPEITLTYAVGKDAGGTNTTTYRDLVFANVKNGIAESVSIGVVESTGTEGTFTFDGMEIDNFDLGRILGMLNLAEGSGTAEMAPIYSSYTSKGGKLVGDKYSCTFGESKAGDLSARPLKVSINAMGDAIKEMDKSVGGTPPVEAFRTVVTFVTDFLQAFSSAPSSVGAISCSGLDEESHSQITVSLGGVDVDAYRPGVYPAITLNDLKIEREDGSVSLDKAVLKAIDLTQPIAAIEADLATITPAWFEDNWRKVIPAFGGFSLEGLAVDIPDPESEEARIQATIASFDMSLSDYLNGIPTRLSTKASGVNVPLDAESTDQNVQTLLQLGIDRVNVGYELSAYWDKATQTVKIDKASIAGEDLGGFAVAALFGNATEKLFDSDADTAIAAGQGLTLKSVKIDVADAGLGDKMVPLVAGDASADPAAVRAQLASTAEGAVIQMLGSTPEARKLGAEISDFIAGKSESVTVNIVAKDADGIPMAVLAQAANDPTTLATAVSVTGSAE